MFNRKETVSWHGIKIAITMFSFLFMANKCFCQEKIVLRYKPIRSEILQYRMVLDNNIEKKGIISTKAERTIIDQNMTIDYSQEVKNITNDKIIKAVNTISLFDLSMKKNEKKFPVPKELANETLGKKFFFSMKETGQILDFNPPQDLSEAPFSIDILSSIFEHIYPILPEKEIRSGSTWFENFEIFAPKPAEGKIFSSFNYTFSGIEKAGNITCAAITYWGTFRSYFESKLGQKNKEINIIGSSEGKTLIALDDGRIIKADEKLTLNIISEVNSEKSGTEHNQHTIKTDMSLELK